MKATNETTKKEYQAPRIEMMQMKLESFICMSPDPDKETDPDTDQDWGSGSIVAGGDGESPWPDGGEHSAD